MHFTESSHVYKNLRRVINQHQEEFWVIALTPSKSMIAKACIFRGTVDYCTIHLRDIFRFVIMHNASSFIVSHNHPSNDVRPSQSDIEVTRKIYWASQIFEIELNDHVIIGDKNYYSFRDRGIFKELLRVDSE